jgi:myo-inositol 2-dehydrogenase/D-chiro-inositol 1-dehydrogenase
LEVIKLKIGLIGTNWGRIYFGFVKKCGYSIDCVYGKNLEKVQRVVENEGMGKATNNLNDLDEMDVIIIASPIHTHFEYIKRFSGKKIFCEKPLHGSKQNDESKNLYLTEDVFVNYSYPFFNTSKEIERIIIKEDFAEVYKITLDVGIKFDAIRDSKDWFVDVAVHPLYFLQKLFGKFEMIDLETGVGEMNLSSKLESNNIILNLNLFKGHEEGISFDLKIYGKDKELSVFGGYKPAKMWFFEPIKVAGVEVNTGEYSTQEDIWMIANGEAFKIYLDYASGNIERKDAISLGLADARSAIDLEDGIQVLLE